MSSYRDIAIADIDVGNRLRVLDPSWVALLAEEIGTHGQSTPIRVVERGAGFKLVDGARRIAALLSLGRTTIEARVESAEALADDTAVRLGEIKGNMLRGDLTALDRAVYVATWCDIYKGAAQPAKRGPKPAQPTTDVEREEFSATMALNWTDAAKNALQIGRRSIFRSLKIADLDASLRARISSLPVADKQNELLLLAEEGEAKQTAIVDMLTAEPARATSVMEALAILGGTAATAPIAAYERVNDRLSALKLAERESLYELRVDEIEIWLARRNSAKRAKVA